MFTPALTSMMLHSFWADITTLTDPRTFDDERELADQIGVWLSKATYKRWPTVPVVGRVTSFRNVQEGLGAEVAFDELRDGGGGIVWGRVPVDRLVSYYRAAFNRPESDEVFDLGTPLALSTIPPAPTTHLPAEELDQCDKWLRKTNKTDPDVHICVIDQGEDAPGGPEDFGTYLTHAETTNVQLSVHALQTLYALLERLKHHGILSKCRIYCSLVRPPAGGIGRKCFDHAGATELVAAVRKTQAIIPWSTMPVLFNMSMGTHAGPHTGSSPLETYIARQVDPAQGRYFFASGGNDGLRGVSNRAFLAADIQDSFVLRTGSARSNELLLELWWQNPPRGDVRFEVQLFELDPLTKAYTKLFTSPIRLDSGRAGVVLKQQPQSYNNVVCKSLFHRKCYKNLSCAAFALSTNGQPGLPAVDVQVTARSTHHSAVVNGWIVVADDPGTAFICGNKSGSVTLPASDVRVVGVSGMRRQQPWPEAARGPAAVYTDYTNPRIPEVQRAPWLAHDVELGTLGAVGTSFASPRACADAANHVRHPNNRMACGTVEDLVARLLNLPPPLAAAYWNGRWGYGPLS